MTRLKRYLKNPASLVLLFSLLLFSSNCTLRESPYKRREVEERIIGSFKKDFGLDVVTRVAGDSLYVYIPVKGGFLTTVKTPPLPKVDIKFLYADCAFKDRSFSIRYAAEILPEPRLAPENITQNITDEMQEIWGKLYQLFQTALTDSPDHFSFFVIYVADIEEGIEMKTTIEETDLKKFFTRAIPPQEFGQRTLRSIRGGDEIVGDTTGRHVDFKDIDLKDFICDIVTQRLTYSRLQSDMIDSIQEEVLKIFYTTVAAYGFVDYDDVELVDVIKGDKDLFFRHRIERSFEPLLRRFPPATTPAQKE